MAKSRSRRSAAPNAGASRRSSTPKPTSARPGAFRFEAEGVVTSENVAEFYSEPRLPHAGVAALRAEGFEVLNLAPTTIRIGAPPEVFEGIALTSPETTSSVRYLRLRSIGISMCRPMCRSCSARTALTAQVSRVGASSSSRSDLGRYFVHRGYAARPVVIGHVATNSNHDEVGTGQGSRRTSSPSRRTLISRWSRSTSSTRRGRSTRRSPLVRTSSRGWGSEKRGRSRRSQWLTRRSPPPSQTPSAAESSLSSPPETGTCGFEANIRR
jgi:hypothetical protein